MFEVSNDPNKTLSFDDIDRVVHYMKDGMHYRGAAKEARSRVKSPHWWDDQNFITGKFTKEEFVVRVMDHMDDQAQPYASTQPTGSAKPCFVMRACAFSNRSEPAGVKPTSVCASRISKIGCMGIT